MELNMQEMQAGKLSFACGLAIAGLAASAIGAGVSLATLNPLGVALGVAGIYAGGPSVIIAC